MQNPRFLDVGLTGSPEFDREEEAHLLEELRARLLDLDVDSVSRPHGEARAEGAKSGGVVTWGTLIVSFSSPAVLAAVVGAVRAWALRRHTHAVKLTLDGDVLEVTGLAPGDEQRLVDAWLARHRTPEPE